MNTDPPSLSLSFGSFAFGTVVGLSGCVAAMGLAGFAVLGVAAVLGRLSWTPAEVVDLVDETPRVRSLVLDVAGWPGTGPASTSTSA